MPKYQLKNRAGRVLDTIEASSQEEAFAIYQRRRTATPPALPTRPTAQTTALPTQENEEKSTFRKAWDWANESFLPERKFGNALADFAYEEIARPTASPLGVLTSGAWLSRPAGLAIKAAARGLKGNTAVSQAVNKTTQNTGRKGNWLRRLTDETKQMALTAGLPGTNISWHGLSTAATNAMATPLREGGLLKGAIQSGRALIDQKYAARKAAEYAAKPLQIMGQTLKKKSGKARNITDFAKASGLTVDIGQQAVVRQTQPLLTAGKYNPLRKVREVQEEMFDKPLFGDMIPFFKLQQFERSFDHLTKAAIKQKGKLNPAELKNLGRQAAKTSNEFFGGLGKHSRWNKEVLQPILLAPDWYERHVRLATGVGKSLVKWNKPEYDAYRNFAENMVATLGVMDLANKQLSGKHLWENEPGKFFEINTGQKDSQGKTIYLAPTAGGLDFTKIPVDVAHAIATGRYREAIDPVLNRLSTVMQFARNTLGWGYRPSAFQHRYPKRERLPGGGIRETRDLPGKEVGRNILEDFGDAMMPGWIQTGENALHRALHPESASRDQKVSKQEAVAKSFELPMRFRKDRQKEVLTRSEVRRRNRQRARERRRNRRNQTAN